MAKVKKPQNKNPENNRIFSSRDKLVLYYKGEKREFKNFYEFNKETNISGAVIKDLVEGKLLYNFKGWDIIRDRS